MWKAVHFTLICTHWRHMHTNIRSINDLCLRVKMALHDDDEDSDNDSKIMKSRYGQQHTHAFTPFGLNWSIVIATIHDDVSLPAKYLMPIKPQIGINV